ncbi:MAG TPA: CoA transferase [Verrucomicrobiae bacterium]|nr:CoA transferase [Verrucomicrobiae bacterium]
MGALAGIRVIDLTSVVMGPYATQILGEMGADVIKVEPLEGDVVRNIGPARHAGMGALFLNANRNKRSLCIDLKRAEGRDAVLRLASNADVFVSNIRPNALRRLELDDDVLARANPRLIRVNLTGFGQSGPYAARPAYDDLIQGASGLAALSAQASGAEARYAPLALADRVAGLFAANAISAALFERAGSGLGQSIEVPMFETMASFVLADHAGGLSFTPPLNDGGYQRLLTRDRRPFKTADGHICAIIYTDQHWRSFLAEIGMEDLPARDPRFANFASRAAHVDAVYSFVAEILATRTSTEWLERLGQVSVPVAPMHNLRSLTDDPHLAAVDFFESAEHPSEGALQITAPPVRWSRTPAANTRHAPILGEHSAEILTEAGFVSDAIAALISAGIVQTAIAPC